MADSYDDKRNPTYYKAAQALATVLRASESRRKLYGVDAPIKVQTTTTNVMSDDEAARVLREAGVPIPGDQ
jgi:hypothetical protein